MKPNERFIVILAGPSGIGKTTLSDCMIAREPRYELIRSITTRPPRGDRHDDEYIYLTRGQFEERLASFSVLEHTEYNGNLYGTPKSEVDRVLAEGRIPLLILDMNGVRSIRGRKDDFATYALYLYDDLDTIEQRLYDRSLAEDPTADKLLAFEKRRQANIRDYLALPDFAPLFDGFVRNHETIEQCCEETMRRIEMLRTGAALPQNTWEIAEKLSASARAKKFSEKEKP